MKAKITRRTIDQLTPEPGKQTWLYDTELPGFAVLCQASGRHRAWLTQRQIADLLGHRQLSTTARYINSEDEHKRETVGAWGANVERLVVGK